MTNFAKRTSRNMIKTTSRAYARGQTCEQRAHATTYVQTTNHGVGSERDKLFVSIIKTMGLGKK